MPLFAGWTIRIWAHGLARKRWSFWSRAGFASYIAFDTEQPKSHEFFRSEKRGNISTWKLIHCWTPRCPAAQVAPRPSPLRKPSQADLAKSTTRGRRWRVGQDSQEDVSLAGLAKSRMFRRRAAKDILRTRNSQSEYLTTCVARNGCGVLAIRRNLWEHDEQVYPDVNLRLIEELLRLEPNRRHARLLRTVASDLLYKKLSFVGWSDCAAVAPLLILRFGDRRSLPLLKRCMENATGSYPPAVVRAAAVVVASYGLREFRIVRRMAARP